MSTTTYKTMDISDLGDNCTQEDLDAFKAACERERYPDESDQQVTDRLWTMWVNGYLRLVTQ